eukprot:Colp12_sorted_trinity150504_noHs@28567
MDDLIDSLNSTFRAEGSDSLHFRQLQYKNTLKSTSTQSARRSRHLELQKQQRRNLTNYARRLAGDLSDEEAVDPTELTNSLPMETEETEPTEEDKDADEKPKRENPYRNQLMRSEWMEEVPEDLEKNWQVALCPVGKRTMVVSSRGHTKAYLRSGYMLNQFPSGLPSGNRHTESQGASRYCILDCIYDETTMTFYVLDLLCWGGHPILDTDSEFRNYWLQAKLEETSVAEKSRYNPYSFVALPRFDCKREELERVVKMKLDYKLDGLLFFHKQGLYVAGVTPLCVWLTPD